MIEKKAAISPMKKQILLIILNFSSVAVLMIGILLFQSAIMSNVRSYVQAEGLYSKGQKDAVLHLIKYIKSGSDQDYENFHAALKIPLGAYRARTAMQSDEMDYLQAYQGFLQMGSHPEDIDGLIWFFHYFKSFPYMAEAVEIWIEADRLILQIDSLGIQIRENLSSPKALPEDTLQRLDALNQQLAKLEIEFSLMLSAGSRWVKSTLTWVGLGLFLLAMILAALLSQRIWKDIDHAQRTLIENKNQLKEQNQTQKRLFAIIGHELRTPAASLKMLMDKDAQLDAQYTEILQHMLNILDDMSVVTNPERAIQGKHSVTSIKAVIDDLMLTQNRLMMERGMHLRVEMDVLGAETCYFNAQLVRQIILNLIKNAALHGSASQMLIKVSGAFDLAASRIKVKIIFEDNGKGIAKQYHDDLFNAFARADSTQDGTGLGLYLSQKFAREALDGDLIFDSTFEAGCRFILTMDLLRCSESDAVPADKTQIPALNDDMTILYAEDNPLMREVTAEMLTKLGAHVVSFEDGQQALNYLSQHIGSVDVLLTDAFMPEMDGFELIKNARLAGFDKTIIAATAATVGDELQQLKDSGADYAIEKPIDMSRLVSILKS